MTVYGNTEIVNALHEMVSGGRIPHAMMFHEDDGGGAFPILMSFLKELYGGSPRVEKLIHPDIHFVFPVAGPSQPVSRQFIGAFRELVLRNPYFYENELYSAIGIEGKQSNISVYEARSVLEQLSLSAVEGGYRTVVLYLPEKMNVQAANALLKMVEEPPEKTLFLLITHQPEKVLVTIASRCLFMRIQPLSREAIQAVHPRQGSGYDEMADLFHDLMSALLSRNLLSALETGEALADLESREKQKAFCRFAGEQMRIIFLLQQNLSAMADIPDDREPFFRELASRLKPTFPRMAMTSLDRAILLLERNVNQKILFTDLVSRFYTRV